MKLLIGNSGYVTPDSSSSVDSRAWAQRVLWLADEGDIVVLSDQPDATFLEHVCAVKGILRSHLNIFVPPAGVFGRRAIDPMTLLSPEFVVRLSSCLSDLSEILPLYPGVAIAELASALGAEALLPGAEFFRQGGAMLADSKATFRAIAASGAVPVAKGWVCYSKFEAIYATHKLVSAGQRIMVKRVHGSGGSGNEIVIVSGDASPPRIGARQISELTDRSIGSVRAYWDERWRWMSEHERYPVVVEQLLDVGACLYVECFISDDQVEALETGSIFYEGGLIVREVAGLAGVTADVEERLLAGTRDLLENFQGLGYRGSMDVDAILEATGKVFFSEVNARTTSGTWLRRFLADSGVRADLGDRVIRQEDAPAAWGCPTTAEFVAILAAGGLTYDRGARSGVLLATPISARSQRSSARYALVCAPHNELDFTAALDKAFSGRSCADSPLR